MARDADRLVARMTPTLALNALSLRHRAEVTAECLFFGVQYHAVTKERIDAIASEVAGVGDWFHGSNVRRSRPIGALESGWERLVKRHEERLRPKMDAVVRELGKRWARWSHYEKRRAVVQAKIDLLSALAKTYGDHNQFEEEQSMLGEIRALLSEEYWLEKPGRRFPLYLLRRYTDHMVGNLGHFALAVPTWIGVFGLGLWAFSNLVYLPRGSALQEVPGHSHGHLWTSFSTFMASSLQGDLNALPLTPFGKLWAGALIVVSFLHLAILISHLYSRIARR